MIRPLSVFVFMCVLSARAATSFGDFENANRLYEKGDYAGAMVAYEKLASNGKTSAALLFNLGNAAFKSGQPGKAIAAYRRAQTLAPRDPDIRANLRFARESVPGNTTRAGAVDKLFRALTLRESGSLSTAFVWIWFVLLGIAQLKPSWKTPLKVWQTGVGTLAVVFLAFFWSSVAYQRANRVAVVTAPGGAPVRFGPLEESQTSYNVRDGMELRITDRKGDWLQVSDVSGRPGWIMSRDVQEVGL